VLLTFVLSIFISWKISRSLVDIMDSKSCMFFALIWPRSSSDSKSFESHHIQNWLVLQVYMILASLFIGNYSGQGSFIQFMFISTVMCPLSIIFLEVVKDFMSND
jgi:hypothetical protein